MNSYPSELYARLHPLMFAAGLGEQSPTPAAGDAPVDEFVELTKRLRHSLESFRPRQSVWGDQRKFSVLLVDKVSAIYKPSFLCCSLTV